MAIKARRKRTTSDSRQLNLLEGVPMISSPKSSRAAGVSQRKRQAPSQSNPDDTSAPRVLTASEAARYLNLSIATLKSWRAKKTGPAFVKRGARLIGYRTFRPVNKILVCKSPGNRFGRCAFCIAMRIPSLIGNGVNGHLPAREACALRSPDAP
jgi:hypothetical protein